MVERMPRIHLWCPSVRASEGGIESYSFSLARALREIVGERDLTVLVRNDQRSDVRGTLGAGVAQASTGWLPKALWTAAFAFLVLARALRERPDLIITTHLNFAPFARFVRKLAKIPYWVVLHGYESWDIQRPSQQRAVAEADLLLPVSNFTRDRVIKNYSVSAEKVRVLPNTFEPARFNPGPKPDHLLRRHGLTLDDRVILTVGRLSGAERYKGHDRVIRALPLIRAQVSNAKYLVVGSGDDQERLQGIANEASVADSVIFAGRVSHEELPDYYRLCDLYAMPSTGEGFGIVFLEALACGKPVLAGNRDGAVDALNGGKFGVLVDPDDQQALAEAAIALLLQRHSHSLANHAEQLREQVVERFGPERFQEAVARLLTERTK
jgi:glycosyltransferase involved in cell wall biosynthesis